MSAEGRLNDVVIVEDDDKTNVCPICERGFKTMAGMRQHCSKKHTATEIAAIIEKKNQLLSQHSVSLSTDDGVVGMGVGWNKFQIIIDDTPEIEKSYHTFDIIENEGLGDCLFLSVLDFLKGQHKIFVNTPNSASDLREMVVKHILNPNVVNGESNFDRFRSNLTENLQRQIPNFTSKSVSIDTLKKDYSNYMSSPHRYGTTAELCALAEIFNFGFCIIRGIDRDNYTCYNYGSISKDQQTTPVLYLLFSGAISEGHFRLLSPNEQPHDLFIPPGAYKLISDCTSSRFTTIAPTNFRGFVDCAPNSTDDETRIVDDLITDSSFDDFVLLLARCRSGIRVLKRVPRAARIQASNRLAQCVEECLANPNLTTTWKNLLTFAYTSIRVPEKVNGVSLSCLVKKNVLKPELRSASVRSERASRFAPRQVGFGIKGGCEAAAHATRTFIKKNSHRKIVIVKIDLRNAFNELDRDVFLKDMKENCPAIFPYLWQCYSSPSLLFYGDFILLSQNGAQQGDPCGPLVFSFAIQFIIESLISEFVIFYLDDGTIAGEYDSVLRDFEVVKEECSKIGLHINPTKWELFFCSEIDPDVANKFEQLSPGICIVNDLILLGAPITADAFDKVFNDKLTELKTLFQRLRELENFHIAYYVLKNCFAIPKLVFLLRTTPTWNHNDMIEEIDNEIRSALESLTNSHLVSDTWTLASLPIDVGGMGVRRVRDVALPSFLSSINAVSPMVKTMLNLPTLTVVEIAQYEDGLDMWYRTHPQSTQPEKPELQKEWNLISVNRLLDSLQFKQDHDKARLLALQRSESGAWLHALPSKAIGTLLENNAFRITVGLRLGLDICSPHVCRCGSQVDKKGYHGLKCKMSAGRLPCHAELNGIIKKALLSAEVPSQLEPQGLVREDGKRVDGMTLIPWSKGSTLIWDATCTDTFAPSNMKFSVRKAGGAAEDKARRKVRKYDSLIQQNFHFVPFAVETMGPWCQEGINFFNVLSRMITIKTNEPRAKSFLKQRLSIAIQRGNAARVMGTFRTIDKMNEIFYLL